MDCHLIHTNLKYEKADSKMSQPFTAYCRAKSTMRPSITGLTFTNSAT